MSSQTFSTFSEVGMIDARSQNGIITLPLTTDIPYRILTLKDIYGASVASSITLTTQGADVFEDGTTSRILNGAFETTTLYAGQAGFWYTTGGSRLASAAIGSLSTGLITNPLRLGTLSTQTAIQFPGLRTNYTGTVIAGQTTGAGTQELLLYQASSISDQIRLQTTGNIVFEAGAAARSFPSTQALATPTLYIAGTTSNVGVGTATPGSLLDVAGVARAQTISTLTLNTSTINGIIPGAAFNGSTTSLSSATITTSTLATNIFTTSSITSYGNVDIQGSILSNVATEYFVKPVYTSVFTPASIPNLKVWADASKLTSITSNGSGLVLLLSNLTGLGNFASNAGLTPPTTGAFTMNNLNTLSFGGANALVLPSITYTSAYRSLFVVAQTTGNTPFFGVGSPTGSITTANYGSYFYAIGSNANISYYPISGSYLNMPLLVSLYTTSTSNGIFLNGSNIGAISPATFATGSFVDQLGVAGSGGSLQGNYYGASWNFCEVLLYDGVLTPAQRQLVEGYLGWKWGFQTGLIATQPYYSSVPPPFGTAFVAAGSITTDANSNVSFAATNKIRLTAAVEIPTTLIASSMTVSSINGSTVTQLIGAPIQSTVIGLATAGYISSTQLNSTVSGLIITAAAAFTGSTVSLSSGSIYASTLSMSGTLNMCNNSISNVNSQNYVRTGPFSANTINNLMLWVDSADTTSFTLSGSNVTSVTDKSSNAYILSNSANFTYRPLAFNTTYSAFVGAGSGGALGINTSFTTSASPYTIIAVGNSTGNNDSYLYDSTDSANRNAIFAQNNTMYPVNLTASGAVMNANYLIVDVWNSSLNVEYVNGTQTGSNTGAPGNMVGITLGNRYALNGQYTGALCEILFYRGVLSTIDRQTLEGYLSWKWGLQANLPVGHPYKTAGPLGALNPIGTIASDSYFNLTIAPTYKVRLQSPTEWRYITSNVSGAALDLTSVTSYIATTYRFTGSSAITITLPGLTTGAWWTFINAYTGAQVLTFAGTTTGLTSPYSLLQGASITIYSDNTSYYVMTAGSPFTGSTLYLSAGTIQTQVFSTINMTATLASFNTISTVSMQSQNISTQTINVSTVNSGYLSSSRGYISSLRTDNLTVGPTDGFVTIQDLTTGTVSTGQLVAGAGFISSLQINSLSFGPTGYVIVGNFIASSLSTMKLNTQNLYTNNAYIGNVSSQSAILFPGVDGNFKGTAVAEQATGPGTEELLLYKVSTTTDQIRLQTTGNIVFEAGASARSWPSTQTLATPTLYIAGSTSNVGVGTATPAATLDVVGQGRFQILSTLTLNTSTINGIIPGAAFNGSTTSLSSATITTSTLATNAFTTSSIISYGTLDLQGNVLSNVGTEYFIKPLYTTTFSPTSISGLKVWLDASKPTSITSNGSGQVATWSNLAGFANATQSVASNTPVTGQLSINSLNTVQFNPTNEMQFGPISYTTAARTVFAVLVTPFNPSVTNKGTYIFGGQDATLGTSGFHGYQFAASGFEFQTSIGGGSGVGYVTYTALANAGAFSATNAWLLSYHPANGIFVNGTSNSTAANLNTGSFTDLFGSIGQGFNVNTFYVAEFLHYDTTFSLAQRQTVEGYLAWKWGIQSRLNGTHPYLSIAPPPLGITFLAMGGITADTSSNISFSATNKIRLTAPVEIPTTLTTSSLTVSSINSSTISQIVGFPIQSTMIGLGSAGYVSTANLLGHVSTANLIGLVSTQNLVGLISTQNLVGLVSTQNLIGLVSTTYLTTQLQSTVDGLGTVNYISSASLLSTTRGLALQFGTSSISSAFITATQGYISSLIVDSLAIGSNSGFINMGDIITTSISSLQINTGLFTASGAVCTPQLLVSSINGQQPLTLQNLTSTVTGTNSNISSMIDPTELTSTITGLGTAGFISTIGLTYVVASTAQGLGTFGYTSTNQLLSTTLGIYGAIGSNIATTVQPQFTSTVQGLGTAGYISSLINVSQLSTLNLNVCTLNGQTFGGPITSTLIGLGTAGYISSSQLYSTVTGIGSGFTGSTTRLSAAQITVSTISSFLITTGSIYAPAISTSAIVFGTGTGTLLMPDIAPNTLYTSTATASNVQVGWSSNQSPIQFYGFGTYSNSVIVEQSTGSTTQELLVFRGSNIADRIRLQTTGYLSIETGVSSRLYPNTYSNALPTIMIDTRSNVGILLSTPVFSLDVGSTVRAIALSTLLLQTSTIQGATFNRNLYVNYASTFLMDEVSTSFLQGNYNSLLFRTAGTQRAILTQAGYLGVGTSNPQYTVDIAGTTRLSTLYYSTSISYNLISAPLLMASTVNTGNVQVTNVSTAQVNTSTIYGRWDDAQYYVLQTL